MIVVPSLAECEQRDQDIVRRGVRRGEGAVAATMAEEIDRGHRVQNEHAAQDEADGKEGESAQPPRQRANDRCGHVPPSVQPEEFTVTREIRGDSVDVGKSPLALEHAPEPAGPEAMPWRVDVLRGVSVAVMEAMFSGKADGFAEGGGREKRKDELKRTAGAEGPMSEVSMKARTAADDKRQIEHTATHPITCARSAADRDDRKGMDDEQEPKGSGRGESCHCAESDPL
jgi:hypothetical protein